MVVVPCTPLVTKPEVTFTEATEAILLLHVPLGEPLSLNCVVSPPVHNEALPTIAIGVALTEKVSDVTLPQPLLKLIVVAPTLAAVPDVTNPVVLTLATDEALLLHVPLGEPLSLSCVVNPPEHNEVLPTITTGVAFTEKVIEAEPQELA